MKGNSESTQAKKDTKKEYNVNDEVKSNAKNCKIVEVLEDGKFHLKNLAEPFDSFICSEEDFE